MSKQRKGARRQALGARSERRHRRLTIVKAWPVLFILCILSTRAFAQLCIQTEVKAIEVTETHTPLQELETFPSFQKTKWKNQGYTHGYHLQQRIEVTAHTFEGQGLALPEAFTTVYRQALQNQACNHTTPKIQCESDEIIVPYTYQPTQTNALSQDRLIMDGPRLQSVMLNLLEHLTPPRNLEDAPEGENEGEADQPRQAEETEVFSEDFLQAINVFPAQERPTEEDARARFERISQTHSQFNRKLRDTHPLHSYFQHTFPYPKFVSLKLQEHESTLYIKEVVVGFDVKVIQRQFKQAPTSLPQTSQTWCVDHVPDAILSELTGPKIYIYLRPEDETQQPEAIQLFDALQFPKTVHTADTWKKVWLLHLFAQLYQSVFLNLDEKLFPEAQASLEPNAFYNLLMQDLSTAVDAQENREGQETPEAPEETQPNEDDPPQDDDSEPPHEDPDDDDPDTSENQTPPVQDTTEVSSQPEWWQHVQDLSSRLHELTAVRDENQLIAKSIEKEGTDTQGHLFRAYTSFSGYSGADNGAPTLRLERKLADVVLPEGLQAQQTARYMMGVNSLQEFALLGFARIWRQHFMANTLSDIDPTTPASAQHLPRQLDANTPESNIWDYTNFLTLNTLDQQPTLYQDAALLDHIARQFRVSFQPYLSLSSPRRWSPLQRPLLFQPSDWMAVHHFLKLFRDQLGNNDTSLKQAVQSLINKVCPQESPEDASDSETQPPPRPYTLCAYREHMANAFTIALTKRDRSLVFKLVHNATHNSLDLTLETLGVLALNPSEPLGTYSRLPFPRGLFPNHTFKDFLVRLSNSPQGPENLGLIGLFQQAILSTNFSLGRIAQSFVHTNQADTLIQTLFLTNGNIALLIAPKDKPLAPSVLYELPSSCVDKNWLKAEQDDETYFPDWVYPQWVQAVPLETADGKTSTFLAVACGTGEITFFMDGQPLSCGEEEKHWRMHQAMFWRDDFKTQGISEFPYSARYTYETIDQDTGFTTLHSKTYTSDSSTYYNAQDVQGFTRNMLCQTSDDWNSREEEYQRSFPAAEGEDSSTRHQTNVKTFRYLLKDTLNEAYENGIPSLSFINVVHDDTPLTHNKTLHLALGMQNGAIYALKLSKRQKTQGGGEYWNLELPPHPSTFRSASPIHFRHNINPHAKNTPGDHLRDPFTFGAPIDLAFSKPITISQLTSFLPNDASCRQLLEEEVILAFGLFASGNSLSPSKPFLAKWSWFPNLQLSDALSFEELKIRKSCVKEIQNILGHGQIIPLNLNAATHIRTVYAASENALHSKIPHLIIDGNMDGGLAFLNPEHLLGLPQTSSNTLLEEGAAAWFSDWLSGLTNFLPNAYFYFGYPQANSQSLHTTWLTHRFHPSCVGFDPSGLKGSLLGQSNHLMNTCGQWAGSPHPEKHWTPVQFHSYANAQDTLVMLQDGAKNLLDVKPSINPSDDIHMTSYLEAHTSQQENHTRLKNTFPAFFQPYEGPSHLIHFSVDQETDRPSTQNPEVDLKTEISTLLFGGEHEAAFQTSTEDYLLDAMKRYFCSFLTVSYDSDRLKHIPGMLDLPYYPNNSFGFTHPFRDHSKMIIDKLENGTSSAFECATLKKGQNDLYGTKNKATFTQAALQLKTTALDEWQSGFTLPMDSELPQLNTSIQALQTQLQSVITQLSESEVGLNALRLTKQIRSSLLAHKWTEAVAHVRSDTFDNDISFEDDLEDSLDEVIEGYGDHDAPFITRIRQALNSNLITNLVNTWAADHPKETKRYLTLYLTQLMVQTILYTEYFGPALRKAYDTLFEGNIAEAQQRLFNALQFKSITPTNQVKQSIQQSYNRDGTVLDRGVNRNQVWEKLWLCSVNADGTNLSCGRQAPQNELSQLSKDFLKYFLKNSLQIKNRFNIPNEALEQAIQYYAQAYVKKIYLIGVACNVTGQTVDCTDPSQANTILPISFFLYHQRPTLSALDASGKFYSKAVSGEANSFGSNVSPYFDMSPVASYLNAWQINTNNETRQPYRVNTENQASALAFTLPENNQAWSPLKVATGLFATPLKTTEYLVIERDPARGCDINDLNRAANNFRQTGNRNTFVRDVLSKCKIHFSSANLNPNSIAPVGNDHWILLNKDMRSLADIYFQSLWDQLVHRQPETETARLPDAFNKVYQDLVRFFTPHDISRLSLTRYSFNKADAIIQNLIHPLYRAGAHAPAYLNNITPYHDMLAYEVMFPMTTRYLWSPKHLKEFEWVEDERNFCRDHQRIALHDFNPQSQVCLKLRNREKLIAAYDRPHYFFGPSHAHNLLKGYWKTALQTPQQEDPFVLADNTSSIVYPKASYWLNQDSVSQLKQSYQGFATTLANNMKQHSHIWLQKPANHAFPRLPSNPTSWFAKLFNAIHTLTAPTLEENTSPSFMNLSDVQTRSFFHEDYDPEADAFFDEDPEAAEDVEDEDLLWSLPRFGQAQLGLNSFDAEKQVQRFNPVPYLWLIHQNRELNAQHRSTLPFGQTARSQLASTLHQGEQALFMGQNRLGRFMMSLLYVAPLPITELQFETIQQDTDPLKVVFSGCMGSHCHSYGFQLQDQRFVPDTETSYTSHQTMTQRQSLLNDVIMPYLTSEIFRNTQETSRYLVHVSDWTEHTGTHYVALNLTERAIVTEQQPELQGTLGLVLEMKPTEDAASPWTFNLMRFKQSRIVGPLMFEQYGSRQVMCASLLQQDKENSFWNFQRLCQSLDDEDDSSLQQTLTNWIAGE